MTDDNFELTRRQILGTTGAIGLAGAGAGLGTSAFFSDEETFENNTLTAGELDLKVDWEEHYSYPQAYDFGDPAEGLEFGVYRSEPDEGEGFVGFPDPENPQVWLHESDIPAYMDNTSIEAFPDPDNDGIQDQTVGDGVAYDPCEHGADLPEHLDPSGLRTANEDTMGEEEEPAPLVNLEDVKPGDFGELTLSFHLCDNPGYVWLSGEMGSSDENGITEPEAEVDDTGGDPGEGNGELAENIQTVWWYDSRGDNVLQTNCEESLYLTDSGTDPTTLHEVELIDDGSGNPDEAVLTELWPGDDSGDSDFSQTDAIATTPNGAEIIFYDKASGHVGIYDVADDTFTDEGPASGDPGKVVLAGYSPEGELWAADQGTNELYTVDISGPSITSEGSTGISLQGADLAFASDGSLYIWTAESSDQGLYRVPDPGSDTTAHPVDSSNIGNLDATVTGMAIRDAGTGDMVVSDRKNDDIAVVDRTTGSIEDRYPMTLDGESHEYDYGDMTVGELCGQVIRRGTLAEDLAALEATEDGDGPGLPLDANLATDFGETGDPADRECFPPGITNYIGFAWWLPMDVGNEVQSDSVSFDLGFYAEQCRHNDGEGTDTPT